MLLLLVVGCGLAVTPADGAEVDGVELPVAATLVGGVEGDGITTSAGKVTSGDGVATDGDDVAAAADDTSADCCDCCCCGCC